MSLALDTSSRRTIGPGGWLAVIGAVVIVLTELELAAVAFAWAVTGLFGLGEAVGIAIAAVLTVATLALTIGFARTAIRRERDRGGE